MYAKIENGRIVQPPRVLKNVERTFQPEDGEPITGLYNVGYDPNVEPEPEIVAYLLAEGYLPVTEAERPEDGDGYYYVAGYELDGDHFVQIWERREIEPPDPNPEISAERALGIILTGRDSYET